MKVINDLSLGEPIVITLRIYMALHSDNKLVGWAVKNKYFSLVTAVALECESLS